MKNIFDIYRLIEYTTDTYFAGANTANGFCGDYSSIADEQRLECVYIIKGGAGTGKSTLMRKCAKAAENVGATVKYYLCGSDPDSLDCIVIDERIAILDGTSPHTRDMTYPGVSSELIDVSQFLNREKLINNKQKIIDLTEYKCACYNSAYRYLTAAELLEKEKGVCTNSIFLHDKANACIDRLIKKLGKPLNKSGSMKYTRTHALTMKGAVSLSTFSNKAKVHYTVADYFGCSIPFMHLLTEKLISTGFSITVTKLPVPNVVAEIFIDDNCTSIAVEQKTDNANHIINMSRFVTDDFSAELKGEYRLASKIQQSCIEEALVHLKKAAEYHFAIEQCYISAMDYTSLNEYSDSICKKIIEQLQKK